MKRLSCLWVIFIIATNGWAQVPAELIPKDSIYKVAEEMPRFPGCETDKCSQQKFLEFVYQHLKISDYSENHSGCITTVMAYVIEKDGSVGAIEIIREGELKLGKDFIKVLQSMPCWTPGKVGGKVIRVSYTIPFKVRLE